MNHKYKRLLVLLLIAAMALTLPVFSASAADNDPVVEAPAEGEAAASTVPLTGLSLTVMRKGEHSDVDVDIDTADITIDLYLIAAAVADPDHGATIKFDTPNSASGVTAAELAYDNLPKTIDESVDPGKYWDGIRSKAATAILGGDSAAYPAAKTGTADEKIEGLSAGLYLIVARDSDLSFADYRKTDANGQVITVANADSHIYSYLPQLVVLPSTESLSTAGGKWLSDVTVFMKPKEELRPGNIKIVKTVDVIDGNTEKATFVFHVTASWKEGTETKSYDNYVSISLPGNGEWELKETIPVGVEVKVDEVYTGATYTGGVTGNNNGGIVPSPDGEEIDTLIFNAANTYVPTDTQGYGIENIFTSDGSEWNWSRADAMPTVK